VAAAVEALTSRLRKKLDAAVEQYAALPVEVDGAEVRITCGEDAVVTLSPGASGVVEEEGQARCSCLLAPRCLHRAAVLSACPLADAPAATQVLPPESGQPEAHAPAPATDPPSPHASPASDPASPASPQASPASRQASAASPQDPPPESRGAEGLAAGGSGPSRIAAGGPAGPTPGPAPAPAPAPAGSPTAHTASAPAHPAPSPAQVAAAAGLWAAGAAVLALGVPAAGAVPQAELLRAAHSARLAGLPRAEAAALRVVRGLRSAREQRVGSHLADLLSALRELLLIAGRLAAGDPDPALTGTVRRAYEQGGSLRVYGVFREPVISATGYGGVVTHVVTEDGQWFSVADVRPGGAARARGAATAPVAIGSATLNHSQLARSGLLIVGATVSPDGRLGAGKGVRATPVKGMPWGEGPMAALFARPLGEEAQTRLSGEVWSESGTEEVAKEPVGCDLMIVGAAGDHVLARALAPAGGETVTGDGTSPGPDAGPRPVGPLIRLVPASRHPDLAHVANLARLASRPGLCVRVVGRVEPDRTTTLRPLAVAPVPGAELTLRLPAEWQDHADLGYDRLQGTHLPPAQEEPPYQEGEERDPLAVAPLWRVRRLVELAVAGGRRAVAESGRGGDFKAQQASLRRSGFRTAADLATALTTEADRRDRDVFGRLTDPGPDRYAWAWLAATTHLAATERALVRASWD
jgi:SWIM zinc finger